MILTMKYEATPGDSDQLQQELSTDDAEAQVPHESLPVLIIDKVEENDDYKNDLEALPLILSMMPLDSASSLLDVISTTGQ